MCEDHPRVLERLPATRAARRVADRLRYHTSDVRIVDTKEDRFRVAPHREIRHERIVGVQDERRRRGKRGERVSDLLSERVELEVAVHLIAEEIRDDDDARLQPPDRARKRCLVDLEEPEVSLRLG